jgi:carboxylesterase
MWFVISWIAVAVVVAAVWSSRRRALRLRDETSKRLPVGPNGFIPGAGAFELEQHDEAPAVLLLHGGGDTPQTLRYLAEYLHRRGYNVRVPLLPGHGCTLRDFTRVSADEWMETARSAYSELTRRYSWVAIGGLSMGGALSAQLAAELPFLPALALLAPYLAMPLRIATAARLSPLWGWLVPFVRAIDPASAPSIHDRDEAARSLGYGVFTPSALRALHASVVRAIAALPNVKAPTLMIQSREDNRISPAEAQRAFNRIGAPDKELVWLTGAGHVITVDYGREHVLQRVADFFDRHRTGSVGRPAEFRGH